MVKKICGILMVSAIIFMVLIGVSPLWYTPQAFEPLEANGVIENTMEEKKYSENFTSIIEEEDDYDTCDLTRFFFIPFETGNINNATSSYGSCGNEEVFIGLFANTTMKGLSGIQNLCSELAKNDSDFAGELNQFSDWSDDQVISDITSDDSCIVQEFKKLDELDHQRFLNLQLDIMESKYKSIMSKQGILWLITEQHSPALIGSYYSLLNWAPHAGWETAISPEKTDKENLVSLYKLAFKRASYNEALEVRMEKQLILALDILYGEMDENEIITWMENPKL